MFILLAQGESGLQQCVTFCEVFFKCVLSTHWHTAQFMLDDLIKHSANYDVAVGLPN